MLIQRAGVNEKETPNISRYLTAIHERPAYQRAIEGWGWGWVLGMRKKDDGVRAKGLTHAYMYIQRVGAEDMNWKVKSLNSWIQL